jgi:LmbE family N-acetylglucosaminyl deacetylase
MLNLDDFEGCVVVMAHPDDEILWASALLSRARKIVLCYGESPGYPAVGEGRRALLREFPLETVVSLEIPESDVHLAADWRRPVETDYGIACGCNGEAYARNFHLLKEALAAHLAEGDLVITHNPWGEYGHEEHVQVYRAVAAVKRERDFRLFVSGYVSDRVLPFMARNMPRLGGTFAMLPTDKALAERLKRLYQVHDIWTWEDAYAWPDRECFYEVTQPDAPLRADQRTMVSLPVNVLWLDGQLPALRRMLRGVKRRLRTLAYRLRAKTG